MFSHSSTSPARCLAASWLGLAVLSLTIDGLGAGGGTCKFNLADYQERRVKAIKGQILSKLGLTSPPTDDGPEVIPKEVMDLFNRTATLLEQKYRKEKAHCSSGATDDYFAQVPLQFNITQKSHHKSGKCIVFHIFTIFHCHVCHWQLCLPCHFKLLSLKLSL